MRHYVHAFVKFPSSCGVAYFENFYWGAPALSVECAVDGGRGTLHTLQYSVLVIPLRTYVIGKITVRIIVVLFNYSILW